MATRIRTSPEIEHRLPDPYLVAFLGPGPPERPHDAALLQLPLEALDALGALPVGLEREPLHVLARDPEAPVLLADLEPLPGRTVNPVLALGGRHRVPRPKPAHHPLDVVPERFDPLAGLGRDEERPREGLAQVVAQLLVE